MAQGLNEGDRPLGRMLWGLAREVETLLRREMSLAKRETAQKLALVGRDAALIAIGAAGAFGGFLTLLAALVLKLAGAEGRWIRATIAVGLSALAGGGALAGVGLSGLRQADLAPRETLKTLEEDEQWLEQRASGTTA